MYRNLMAELIRAGKKTKDIAKLLNISERGLRNKMNGKTDFTLREAIKIKHSINTDMELETLFMFVKRKSA